MRASDRGVHRKRPINDPRRVGRSGQLRQHLVPGALRRQAVMPGPYRLPRPEDLRQIAPRDPAPVPVDDRLYHRPRVGELPPRPTRGTRQHPLDQRPLRIRKHLKPRHEIRLPADQLNLCQTRPSRTAGSARLPRLRRRRSFLPELRPLPDVMHQPDRCIVDNRHSGSLLPQELMHNVAANDSRRTRNQRSGTTAEPERNHAATTAHASAWRRTPWANHQARHRVRAIAWTTALLARTREKGPGA